MQNETIGTNSTSMHRNEDISSRMGASNLPEKKFSTGAVQATIWNNEIEKNGVTASFKTIVLSRSYKAQDGKWKSTSSLRVNDIPKAALVLQKAYEYLVLKDILVHDSSHESGDVIEEEVY
jgi:hypothetical protein